MSKCLVQKQYFKLVKETLNKHYKCHINVL